MHIIFIDAGFRSRVRYMSVLDPSSMSYYVSEILDAGRDGPLFMVLSPLSIDFSFVIGIILYIFVDGAKVNFSYLWCAGISIPLLILTPEYVGRNYERLMGHPHVSLII